jgi:hypothetical protein
MGGPRTAGGRGTRRLSETSYIPVKRPPTTVMATAALLVAACACEQPRVGGTASQATPSLEMMPVPMKALRRCRATPRIRRVCPTRLPRVGPVTFHRFQALNTRPPAFTFEWGGPRPGLTVRNAPPEMVHVVVQVGDLDTGLGFRWEPKEAPSRALKDKRREPIFLGRHVWGGRAGTVVLAPSYPFGGVNGDHVVFRWSQRGLQRAISLHAWRPVSASVSALRAIVRFLP